MTIQQQSDRSIAYLIVFTSVRCKIVYYGYKGFYIFNSLSILPLFVIANCEGCIFYYVLWRPKYQSPGTRKEQSSRSLFTSCLLGQHSSVERALSLKPIVCFSGAVELLQLSTRCVYNSQSNSPRT